MLNPSNNPPDQQHYLQPLKQLVQKHPLTCCCGLWAVLVLVGSVATVGLFNPGSLEQEASNPTPSLTTVQESTPKSIVKKDLPLSLFGAVALGFLGCAAGSLLVTHALKQTSERRQPPTRLKPATSTRKKRRVSSKKRRPVPRTPQPEGSKVAFQTPDNRLATTNNGKLTQITVLPPEENHPLDGGDQSLADMLDMRKHQSLASLLTVSTRSK